MQRVKVDRHYTFAFLSQKQKYDPSSNRIWFLLFACGKLAAVAIRWPMGLKLLASRCVEVKTEIANLANTVFVLNAEDRAI